MIGQVHFGLRLVALPRQRCDLGFAGRVMQIDGGLLHAQFLFRQAQIDAALFALQFADDLRLGCLHLGLFHVVFRSAQIAVVLLGGDARIGHGLVERSLRLFQCSLFLLQLLLCAAGVEADHRIAFLHRSAGGGLPNDP